MLPWLNEIWLVWPEKYFEPIERLYGRYNCGKEREIARARTRERSGGEHEKSQAIMILRLAHTGVYGCVCVASELIIFCLENKSKSLQYFFVFCVRI